MDKSSHGGRREGAGRKPAPVRMVRLVVSLEPELYDALKEASRSHGSMAEIVREALRAALNGRSMNRGG